MSAPSMLYPSCPKCGGIMADGYLLDSAHGPVLAPQKFIDGPPTRSVWMGLKWEKDQIYGVQTFRCVDCGFLESYARKEAR